MSDCTTDTVQDKITTTCDGLARLLVAKNQRYGNSALEPMRVFSRADPAEGILVRLDDKLSRIVSIHAPAWGATSIRPLK